MTSLVQECDQDPNQVSVFYSTSTERHKNTAESTDIAAPVTEGGDGVNNGGRHSHLWSYSSMDSDEEIDDTKALINIKKTEVMY